MEKFYSILEVASIFRVEQQSIRRMIARKEIDAIKIGGQWRISSAEVKRIKSGK